MPRFTGGKGRLVEARLVFLDGRRKGETLTLSEKETTIGRDAENLLTLDDESISRQHCTILISDDHFEVRDLNSTNGTLVNGVRVSGIAPLSYGDEIRIGHSHFLFTSSEARDLNGLSRVFNNISFADEADILESSVFELQIDKSATKILDTKALLETSREHRAVRDLVTIYRVGNALHSIQELPQLLETILELIFEVARADTAILMLTDRETGKLIPKVSRSRLQAKRRKRLAISHSIASRVLEGGTSILTGDALFDERFKDAESVFINGIRSAICVPLKGNNKVVGLLYADNHREKEAFEEADLRLLTAIGIQAGIAIENILLFQDKKELLLGSIRALVASEEARDPYTRGHSERVATTSVAIAKELQLDEETISQIELAALLHDVGKVGMPDSILRKTSLINSAEKKLVRMHPNKGAEIIKQIKGVEEIAKAVRHHHEKVDGSGYPDGLVSTQIPLASRIIALADAYDAMTSDRPYRAAMSREKTLGRIREAAGVQFDDELVLIFASVLKRGKVKIESGMQVSKEPLSTPTEDEP